MAETELRFERLLRIAGAERQRHPAPMVADAEREILRRVGGSRRQARRRIRARAVFLAALGLALVALAAVGTVYLLDPWGDPHDVGGWIGVGISAVWGLASLTLGVLLLRNPRPRRWPKSFPVISRRHFEVFLREPDAGELLRIVGRDRGETSPDQVAQAENQLRELLAEAVPVLRRRVRAWGTTGLTLGAMLTLWGMVALLMIGLRIVTEGADSWQAGMGAASRLHLAMMLLLGIVNGAFGVVLLAGGLGLRRYRNWARKTVVWAVWMWFAAGVLLTPLGVLCMALVGTSSREILLSLAAALPQAGLWVYILRRITRALESPEVKEVCGAEEPFAPALG